MKDLLENFVVFFVYLTMSFVIYGTAFVIVMLSMRV